MSEPLDVQAGLRLQALHRYAVAVERGDLNAIAAVLNVAERDPVLALLLAELDEADSAPVTQPPARVAANAADGESVTAPNSPDFDTHENASESFHVRVPPSHAIRTASFFRTLAAVLIVGALVAGYFALNQARLGSQHNPGDPATTPAGSPPTAAEGIVVGGTWDGQIVALRPSDGSTYWRYTTRTGEPIVGILEQDQVVYALAWPTSPEIFALRATDGVLLWQQALHADTGIPVQMMATAGVFIVNAGDGAHAFRATDGAPLWTSKREVMAVGNGIVFVGTLQFGPTVPGSVTSNANVGNVEALRARDGKVLWTYATAGRDAGVAAALGQLVYVSLMGGNSVVAVVALRQTDGTLVQSYTVPTDGLFDGGMAFVGVDNDHLYFSGLSTCALDLADGAQAWCTPAASGGGFSGLLQDGNIAGISGLGSNATHTAYFVSAAALHVRDGSPAWHWASPGLPVWPVTNPHGTPVGFSEATQAGTPGVVYAGTPGGVFALRDSDGHLLWRAATKDNILSLAAGW